MSLLQSKQKLQPGDQAPDFSIKATDGKNYTLTDCKDAKALLIIFMCNHCPYVKPKLETIKQLQAKFKDRGLIVIGINSNDPNYDPDDDFKSMQRIVQEQEFNFVYGVDETQDIAHAYGAECTPDPFLFDAEQKLVYQGRFDDALNPGNTPTTHDMEDAIEAVLQGKKPKQAFLFSLGCSIKWK